MSAPRLRRALRAAVLAGALVAALSPAASAATPIACGTVVTTDVRLTDDLVDCPGDAIIAGADGITIDLGGHTVDGVGAGFGVRLGSFAGGFHDVTIRNGTVREFANGIDLEVSDRTTVERMRLRDNTVYGVVAGYQTTGVRIERSVLTGNGFAGVRVQHAADTTVTGNTIADNVRDGVSIARSERTTVTGNTVTGHRDSGIDASRTTGDRIERNVVRGSETDGIVVDQAVDAVVTRNTAQGNGYSGIEVDFGSDGTMVSANRAIGNGRDGVVVWGEGATLTGNLSVGNGEHGFIVHFGEDAPQIDGGGNRAAANGEADCLGIVCR